MTYYLDQGVLWHAWYSSLRKASVQRSIPLGEIPCGQERTLDISQGHVPTVGSQQLKQHVPTNLGQGGTLKVSSTGLFAQVGIEVTLETPP